MTPHLIGLVGKAGAGKDAFAHTLTSGHGYARVAFSDAIKRAAYESDPLVSLARSVPPAVVRLRTLVDDHGWDAAKKFPDVRAYLQNYGMAVRRELPRAWVQIAMGRVADEFLASRHVVITDARFGDEVAAIRQAGGTIVRITRPGAYSGLDAMTGRHVSEQLADDETVADLTVTNDGNLAQLAEKALYVHDVYLAARGTRVRFGFGAL